MEKPVLDFDPKTVDIVLILPESFVDEFVEVLIKDVDDIGVTTGIVKKPDFNIYGAAEWIIDGAITFYVLEKLFDGFLKEAGKAGYTTVKNWLKDTAVNARLIKVKLISSSESPDKLNPSYSQSLSITPHVQLKGGRFIKLLLDDRLSDEDWGVALEKMFDAVYKHHEDYPNDYLTIATNGLVDKPWERIYALIDIETKEWGFFNDAMLYEMDVKREKI